MVKKCRRDTGRTQLTRIKTRLNIETSIRFTGEHNSFRHKRSEPSRSKKLTQTSRKVKDQRPHYRRGTEPTLAPSGPLGHELPSADSASTMRGRLVANIDTASTAIRKGVYSSRTEAAHVYIRCPTAGTRTFACSHEERLPIRERTSLRLSQIRTLPY